MFSCTWNSLQPPTPTQAGSALQTLEHIKSLGVQPAAFLIDDGWQHTNAFRTLQDFNASASFLGEYKSLAEVVKIAKKEHGVRDVGVWHTIQGYWLGVDTGRFGGKYRLVKVTKDGYPGPDEPAGYQYYIPHPASVGSFFLDYYTALREAGVTFTKCDNMASIDHIVSAIEVSFPNPRSVEVPGDPVDVSELRKAYITAVKNAAREVFGAENVIWCMGMTPRLLFGEVGLAGDGLKRICRNSDDYFPNEQGSHGYHVYTNALNGLLLNNLDIRPDFDMFQTHAYISPQGVQNTSHAGLAQAAFHASFRVFDVPLKSDPKILRKLVGSVSPASKSPSTVVQASEPFTATNDILDPTILEGGHGRGMKLYVNNTVGIWNVRGWGGRVVEFLNAADIAHALSLPPRTAPPPVIIHIQTSNPTSESRTLQYGYANPLHPAPPVRMDLDTLGWCSGKLGAWVGMGTKVGRVSVALVGDAGAKGEEQTAEVETEVVSKGKLITVQVKGQSEVVFELA
ncbi:raffinose synthase or seed inhibition domain-containing protein [Ceratobasidium sp. AG-Ba]|nr:raffinose synthase or seed inhibition domain-containing protein [Ceratobasidium sp. AG-Ba]